MPPTVIQVNAAENLDAGNFFPNEIGLCRRGFVMILQDQAAHASLFGDPRQIDCVNRTRRNVRVGMRVKIDDAVEPFACPCAEMVNAHSSSPKPAAFPTKRFTFTFALISITFSSITWHNSTQFTPWRIHFLRGFSLLPPSGVFITVALPEC